MGVGMQQGMGYEEDEESQDEQSESDESEGLEGDPHIPLSGLVKNNLHKYHRRHFFTSALMLWEISIGRNRMNSHPTLPPLNYLCIIVVVDMLYCFGLFVQWI